MKIFFCYRLNYYGSYSCIDVCQENLDPMFFSGELMSQAHLYER
jgi:hypothetical protein